MDRLRSKVWQYLRWRWGSLQLRRELTRASRRKYLLARKAHTSGFGDGLAFLAQWLAIARRAGLTLVVDWVPGRLGRARATIASFDAVYANTEHVLGVPLRLEMPEDLDEDNCVLLYHWYRESLDLPEVQRAMEDWPWLHEATKGRRFLQEGLDFLDGLQLVGSLRAEVDAFRREHFGPLTLGVHLRHGNGEAAVNPWHRSRNRRLGFTGDERVDGAAAVRLCRRAVDHFGPRLGTAYTVFLATDSPVVEHAVLAGIDAVVSRPKFLPPAGGGALHHQSVEGGGDPGILADAVTEMYLLAECDFLACTPSQFSIVARARLPGAAVLPLP